jgi:Predicted dehydrogenases and related proteins
VKEKYKVLLLGAGFWGKRWIRLLQENERVECEGIACAEQDREKILKLSGLSKEKVYGSYEKALEKAEADIMVNVLPAELHYTADCAALEKGMHIIAEKPLVKTMEEAEKLLALSKTRKAQLFMVSQNYRWRSHNVTIKRALDEGMIGRLESISYNFRRKEDLQGYRKNLVMPLINDMCIHHFDLLRFFCDSDCEEITAHAWRPSWSQYGGKPNVDAIIRMKNGIEVSYTGTWAARGMETSWDGDIILSGSKGCLTLNADNEVCFYPSEGERESVLDTGKQKPVILEKVEMKHEETDYGLRYFIQCLDEGTIPVTCLEDNYKSFSMVLACEEAASTGKTVKV